MAKYHDDGIVWCEECVHFLCYGIDGEGECDIDGASTYYGAPAMNCPYFEEVEG